jgi:hypothetical protein
LPNISFQVHPKSEDKIEDYRGTQGQAGNIDEILTNGESGDTHDFPYPGAYTKNLPFNIAPQFVHTTNIKNAIYN